jgi:DNA polymerase-3 subunit epsilon
MGRAAAPIVPQAICARYSHSRTFDYDRGRFVRPGALREECDRVLSARSQLSSYGYAVVDVEATGSSSRRHRVVELAVVLLDEELGPQGEFTTLIDPHGPVGPTHIHGIVGGDLGGAPSFDGVAGRLLSLLRGRVLVGHNVGCDRSFLAAEYARIGVRLPSIPELCTMRMAARRLPVPHGLSLRDCAAAAGVTDWHAHTALGDARATAELFTHYMRAGEPAENGQFVDLLGPDERLALAAAVEWPQVTGLPAVADALWKRRSNDSTRRTVPNVRNGSA